MGGLLDKANAVKDAEIDTEEPTPVKSEAKTVDAPKPVASKIESSSTPSLGGNPDTAMKLNLGGWVIILIGAILSLQGGAWGFLARQCRSRAWNRGNRAGRPHAWWLEQA